ncbi:C45 family autoproteolytic acyltransferase/hydolase [Phytohabitans suffuscus]|uniref:Acyl-CoA--6-aminopenicillanic acid acyl-transferase n=1 Tax=Phytohabitans suffuscus TaxID=624315 RepID=A0A6F8YJW0_9ACTN|nr:C45 family peptidase [Phytohabitans suffuscus]BCB86414.1 acyl-CoA--6-aminopenicillanic acid acyl-transferase [Phytohabitans suffuscus]
MNLPISVISVSGTPAECGAAYGAAAAPLVAANITLYLQRFRDQAGLDATAVRAAGTAFRRASAEVLPRVAAMLDGVAEGAGVKAEELYAINGRTELIYGKGKDGDGGCTSIGVLDTHTTSRHTLLGQNWDWHPAQREAMVVLHTRDEEGFEVITLAEAGMLAKAGLNSAGLGVCLNMLGSDRDGPRDGVVPYHVLLRGVLESDHLGAALRVAARTPRGASLNLLLGQAGKRGDLGHAGKRGVPGQAGGYGGEIIDVEVVPGDIGWLHPVDGFVTHANHMETAVAVRDRQRDFGGASFFRGARARRLLGTIMDARAERKVHENDLMAVFRDHGGYPMAICRHIDERDEPLDRAETVYSVLLDLDERRFGLAEGPPCGNKYGFTRLG